MKKFKSIYIVYVCIGLLSASLVGCQKEEGVQILPERNYVLVWSDEFDGAAGELVDSSIGPMISDVALMDGGVIKNYSFIVTSRIMFPWTERVILPLQHEIHLLVVHHLHRVKY